MHKFNQFQRPALFAKNMQGKIIRPFTNFQGSRAQLNQQFNQRNVGIVLLAKNMQRCFMITVANYQGTREGFGNMQNCFQGGIAQMLVAVRITVVAVAAARTTGAAHVFAQ